MYRIVPWIEGARKDEPGHPLYAPAGRRGGRIDNPDHYRVLYAASDAAGAFAEAFGNKSVWRAEMLRSSRLPIARRSLVEIDTDARILDLDDARGLLARKLRPSDVATPDRAVTQRWALEAFALNTWDGVRWWSIRDARWSVYGLWSARRRVVSVTPLTLGHPAAHAAAEILGKVL